MPIIFFWVLHFKHAIKSDIAVIFISNAVIFVTNFNLKFRFFKIWFELFCLIVGTKLKKLSGGRGINLGGLYLGVSHFFYEEMQN